MNDSMKRVFGGVCAPKGFSASGVHCGIRKNQRKLDLALILSEVECAAAAVYTQNKVFGAPIAVTRDHLSDGRARAVIVNSGNANTCNSDGVEKALRMCELAGERAGVSPEEVIVASTGVIGVPFDIAPIESGMRPLVAALDRNDGADAARAIMTTDTRDKQTSVEFDIGGVKVRIGAMSKGSGMIEPNMATLLGFITTDASISAGLLREALLTAVGDSYNMVSVDGDTSTNDMVCALANGLAGNEPILDKGEGYAAFLSALSLVCAEQAKMIAGDGEGATKLIECSVTGAPSVSAAKKIAKSVINSSLIKSMLFAADANWGRVLCAVGYAQADFSVDGISVSFESAAGAVKVYGGGGGIAFDEGEAKAILSEAEVRVAVDLGQGGFAATAWGCDLTYDYVKINGSYRT